MKKQEEVEQNHRRKLRLYEEAEEEIIRGKERVARDFDEMQDRVQHSLNQLEVDDHDRYLASTIIENNREYLLTTLHQKQKQLEMEWEQEEYLFRKQQQEF